MSISIANVFVDMIAAAYICLASNKFLQYCIEQTIYMTMIYTLT